MRMHLFPIILLLHLAVVRPSSTATLKQYSRDWLISDLGTNESKRISAKSVFIAPSFSTERCADGYREDPTGRCVKLVRVSQSGQLDFLLERLNAMYGAATSEPTVQVEESVSIQSTEVISSTEMLMMAASVNTEMSKLIGETSEAAPVEETDSNVNSGFDVVTVESKTTVSVESATTGAVVENSVSTMILSSTVLESTTTNGPPATTDSTTASGMTTAVDTTSRTTATLESTTTEEIVDSATPATSTESVPQAVLVPEVFLVSSEDSKYYEPNFPKVLGVVNEETPTDVIFPERFSLVNPSNLVKEVPQSVDSVQVLDVNQTDDRENTSMSTIADVDLKPNESEMTSLPNQINLSTPPIKVDISTTPNKADEITLPTILDIDLTPSQANNYDPSKLVPPLMVNRPPVLNNYPFKPKPFEVHPSEYRPYDVDPSINRPHWVHPSEYNPYETSINRPYRTDNGGYRPNYEVNPSNYKIYEPNSESQYQKGHVRFPTDRGNTVKFPLHDQLKHRQWNNNNNRRFQPVLRFWNKMPLVPEFPAKFR